MSSKRKHRADILVLAAYIVLAIVLTYPLVLNLSTHVAGDGGDDPALAWNLWWVPHAIINLGRNPIYTNYMFYPIGLNLAFYTLTYLNAFLSIPLQFAFNLVVAANVNLWFSFAVGGFGAYLLAKFVIQNLALSATEGSKFEIQNSTVTLAAFIAGVVYAFSSNKLLYASLGQFNIASSHWIPFYVLFLLKLTRGWNTQHAIRNTMYYGFLLGLFLLFQALSEFIFASFLIIFTAIYLVYWLLTARSSRFTFHVLLPAFLVAILTFTLPMSPILAAMIQDMLTEGDFIQRGLGFADVFSSDVLGFFVPSHLHPVFGNLESQFHFAYTNFAYLGFAALGLAALALWKKPHARIWGVFGAIFVLISLGPNLRVNGDVINAPFLPFNLLLEIPLVKGNRYPSRWSVMVTLCLAVLVGYGVAWISEKLKVKSQKLELLSAFAFLLLTSFEHFSFPLPISNLQSPTVYETIARDQGDFTVLEIPLAWRNGFRMTGTLDQAMMFAQWYQTEHRRPILGGNTSRNPELKFQYFTESPIIQSLIAIETGHTLEPAVLERDRQLAPTVLNFFGVRYVVWHSPRNPHNRPTLDAARAYAQYILPATKFYEVSDDTGETVAFRVNEIAMLSEVTIRPGDMLARLHFAEGWGALSGERFVWAQRHEAKMFARLDTRGRDARLELSAVAPPSISEQPVTVVVNGQRVGRVVLTQCLDCKTGVTIPASALRAGMNEIVFQFERVAPVAGIRMGSSYMISRDGPQSPVNLVVRSAGSEVGDFAHIYVNGADVSPNERGYNIVVINAQTGAVETSAVFDTFESESESARLARYIAAIPQGKIVAVAVRDEASRSLTQEAVDALRSIGATEDLRERWRWSHALIGAKGAAPGSVWEAAFETLPAQLVVGVGAMEPNVAAAMEWMKIEAK
jgi:hypothetical protein